MASCHSVLWSGLLLDLSELALHGPFLRRALAGAGFGAGAVGAHVVHAGAAGARGGLLLGVHGLADLLHGVAKLLGAPLDAVYVLGTQGLAHRADLALHLAF